MTGNIYNVFTSLWAVLLGNRAQVGLLLVTDLRKCKKRLKPSLKLLVWCNSVCLVRETNPDDDKLYCCYQNWSKLGVIFQAWRV